MTLTYFELCKHLGVELEPGQWALARVAFDPQSDLYSLFEVERSRLEIFRNLFGCLPQRKSHSVVAVIAGARSGKSYFLGALRLLHLALTVDLSRLAKGETAFALMVAPDLKLARQPLGYLKGFCHVHPDLKERILAESADGLTLYRDEGQTVRFECLAATRGGSALRGRSFVGAFFDESAFFRDSDYVVNDADLFKAVTPRILPGGQLVLASTPWAKSGLLYELYKENWGAPKTALVAHAATETLRSDPAILEMVAREKERDPENHRREYLAEFVETSSARYLDEAAITKAVFEDRELEPGSCTSPKPGDEALAGADLGFVSDCSALVTVVLRNGVFWVTSLLERKPEPGKPLHFNETVTTFARYAKVNDCDAIMADLHYRVAVQEALHNAGVGFVSAPEGVQGKNASYAFLKALFNEGRIRIPNHPRLLKQLRELTARPTPGGLLSIQSPRSAGGGHGDIVSALVLAVWQRHGEAVKAPEPQPGSKEWYDREEERIWEERERRASERLENEERDREYFAC